MNSTPEPARQDLCERIRSLGPRRQSLLALCLLVPAPSIGTLCALDLFPGPAGQVIYAICKVWLLGFPLLWLRCVEQRPWSWSPPRHGGLGIGLLLGLVMGAVILGGYQMASADWIDREHVRTLAVRNGFGTIPSYLGLTIYLTLVNSLLEEYVWRWFVFRRAEQALGSGPAVVCAALFFTIHHTVALRIQFGWAITLFGSLGVFLSGLVWTGCYLRYRSVWPGYLSHILADTAIFIAGWHMLFG
jgi:membrane protease YdiL (CAAX protease family)